MKPKSATVLELIALTPTKGPERAMLLAASHWVNWRTGELWPSLAKWAGLAGIGTTTARRALRKLEALQLLKPVSKKTGGFRANGAAITTRYQLLPEAGLWNVEFAVGISTEPGRLDHEGGRIGRASQPMRPLDPAAPAAKPSNQPLDERPTELTNAGSGGVRAESWMVGGGPEAEQFEARRILSQFGVKGQPLAKLCQFPLARIRQEISNINADPTVANPAGVLLHRLLGATGSARAALSQLEPESRDVVGNLVQMRRRARPAEPSSLGGSVQSLAFQVMTQNR